MYNNKVVRLTKLKMKKKGDSWYVLIPAKVITHNGLNPDLKYDIAIREANGEDDEE